MPNTYATTAGKVINGTGTPDVGLMHGSVYNWSEVITYASQADGDTVTLCRMPKGAIILGIMLCASATSGSTTLAIGISGTTAKYKAAAALTATDTPTWVGKAAALNVRLTADEDWLLTGAGAAWPAAGTLTFTVYYVTN